MTAGSFARVPQRWRDDALQEAWLAHLQGADAAAAVAAFVRRERRRERREVAISQLGDP